MNLPLGTEVVLRLEPTEGKIIGRSFNGGQKRYDVQVDKVVLYGIPENIISTFFIPEEKREKV